MRLALVAVCLLVVVAVTISPSSGNSAPGIKDKFTNVKEKLKGLVDKTNESFKNFWNKIRGGLRGRRDVDFKNVYYSELSAISDLVSALSAASDDILSSVEDVDKILEEGFVEDDVSDQDDSDEDGSGEDVDEGDVDGSVEDVDKILEEGFVEDDVSDQDDSDEDEAGEDVDEGDVDDEKVEDTGEGGGENVDAEDVDNGDAESGSKGN